MSILVVCPGCGAKSQARDTAAGKRGKCGKCGAIINIPSKPSVIASPDIPIEKPTPAPRQPAHAAMDGATAIPPRIAQNDIGSPMPQSSAATSADRTGSADPRKPPIQSQTVPLVPVTPLLPPLPQEFALKILALYRQHPRLGAAVAMTFLWALVALLVAMYQISNNACGWGIWNVLVAGGYVLMGVGLFRRRRTALNWGIAGNMINSVLILLQIIDLHIPALALLLILQVLIIAFLIIERRAFTGDSDPLLQPTLGHPAANVSSQLVTGRQVTASHSAKADAAPVAAAHTQQVKELPQDLLSSFWRSLTQPVYMFGEGAGDGVMTKPIFIAGGGTRGGGRKWILIAVVAAAVIGVGTASILITRAVWQNRPLGGADSGGNTSDISFARFDAEFGNTSVFGLPNPSTVKRTSAQTGEERQRYVGKIVRWEGIVADVRDDQVLIRHRGVLEQGRTNEVALIMSESERSSLAGLSRGDLIEYSGSLNNFGNPYPYTLTEGKVISHRTITLDEQMNFMGKLDKQVMDLTVK